MNLIFDRVENIVGKGENADISSTFSFSHPIFKSLIPQRKLKFDLVNDLKEASTAYYTIKTLNNTGKTGL